MAPSWWALLLLTSVLLDVSASHSQLHLSQLIVLDPVTYPLAVCLDGTPAGYYFRRARSVTAANKWYVHHEGGGWCQLEKPYQSWPDDNCVARASTRLGTLRFDNVTANWTSTIGCAGCSTDPSINPLMHDWNSVYIRYCDGGSFSGMRTTPVVVNATARKLHFQGGHVRAAIVRDLAARFGTKWTDASDVVVGGSSAGGLAAILHLDWWRSQLPTSTNVVGLPDSGFFLDWNRSKPSQATHSYNDDLRWGFLAMNSSFGVDQSCVAAAHAHGRNPSDCAFAQGVLPFVRTPLFLLQSVYDSWQLQWEHGMNRSPNLNLTALNAYGAELAQLLAAAATKAVGRGGRVGGFIDRCYHHCTTTDLWMKAPVVNGNVQSSAFSRWYAGDSEGILWQPGEFPCQDCGCPSGTIGPRQAWEESLFV